MSIVSNPDGNDLVVRWTTWRELWQWSVEYFSPNTGKYGKYYITVNDNGVITTEEDVD